jgi:hypothetical protein
VNRLLIAACAGVATVTLSNVAAAVTCAAPTGADPTLSAVDGRARLHWIDARLEREASKARLWADAWAIGIGAAGLASLAPAPFVAAGDRIDWYTGAATAAIGVVPFIVSPLSVTRDAPKLHAALADAPDDAHVCALLADAEHKLAGAADERWQRGWWIHAGNVVFNTGVLLFLGVGYHHWGAGLANGLSGAAVGETIIFTQPTGAVDDHAAYERGDLSAGDARPISLGWSYGATF